MILRLLQQYGGLEPRLGLRYAEVPVPYRRRIGRSKVSGTVRGAVGAGIKILGLLAWHDLKGMRR